MTAATRDVYTAQMKQQLDQFNARIDELAVKASALQLDARSSYEAELAKLRHQSHLAMSQMAEMKLAGEQGWDHAVQEMDKLRDAFSRSFHYFKSQV